MESVRNYLVDRKYGGYCGWAKKTSFAVDGAYGISSCDYSDLRRLFHPANGIELTAQDVLVDIGCGRGRVINYWLGLGLGNKIVGVEIEETVAREAAARLARFPNVTILHGNALELIPSDGTVFHLFNPFDAPSVGAFKRALERLDPQHDVTVVYHYSLHVGVFADDPRWTVDPVRTKTFYPSSVIRLRRDASQQAVTA